MTSASLPWYDFAETRVANDALWAALSYNLRKRGIANVPEHLQREIPYEQLWLSGDFLLSQACGYDVLLAYPGKMQLVATPCYNAPGCIRALYRSFVVVHADSPVSDLEHLRGKRCVINAITSHSGMSILRALVAPFQHQGRFFSKVSISGAHENSLNMIAEKKADVAAIDCITYALLQQYRSPLLTDIRVLCRTQAAPAPPFVTGVSTPRSLLDKMRIALKETLQDQRLDAVKQKLFLSDVEFLEIKDYRPISEIKEIARHIGYREMEWNTPFYG